VPSFPPGFGWPANPQTLDAQIRSRDTSALRAHGWWLWAGINTLDGNGRPIWWDWPTSTQAYPFQPQPSPIVPPSPKGNTDTAQHGLRGKNAANTPINLPSPIYLPPKTQSGQCLPGQWNENGLADGQRFQSNGDIMIAGVIYNETAFDWIERSQLNDSTVLTASQGAGRKDIVAFPASSIVLKNMYWPARGDDFTALPVWHDEYPPGYGQYAGYEVWKSVVIIDPRIEERRPGTTGVTKYLHNVRDAQGQPIEPKLATGQVYPVKAFYHQRLDEAFLASLDARDRAILDASACWLYNRPFKAGDYLVTVAMHIITKEVPQWTLQSLWWSDAPSSGPFHADRPDISSQQAPGPWRQYLLTIEYGIPQAPGVLPVSFNPYIELAAGHPVSTNWRNCHIRAAWPRANAVTPPPAFTNNYLAPNGPDALADFGFDNAVFTGLMRVDFQWAVADRAGSPAQK